METMEVIFHSQDYYGKKSKPEPRTITAATRDKCFAEFFKRNNRLKYCNGTYYSFADWADHEEYHNEWDTLKNYITHGGCME